MLIFLLWLLGGQIVSSANLPQRPTHHVIIFDAGSTGTRLHLYNFHNNSKELVLVNEVYEEIKPGLSAYAQNPEAIKQPLEKLLSKARDAIPESERSKTPLTLGATAGLRLLPENQAEKLLEICQDVFLHSGFLVSRNSASMLDEVSEGIYCWMTANYLLKKFSAQSSDVWKNNVVLDLGGGSTQITMAVSNSFVKNPESDVRENLYKLAISDQWFNVYTTSILGLGLMAARKDILCYPNKCLEEKWSNETVKIESDCVVTKDSTTLKWIYMGQRFEIRGTNETKKLKKCLDVAKQMVSRGMKSIDLPSLEGRRIIGVSFYVDRAADAKAIESSDGGDLYVKNYYEYAEKFFDNPDDSQPFLGLDLVYIYSMLRDGLKVNDDVLMILLSNYKGYGVSWTLGNAINVLQNGSITMY